jgi:hypothetical protein
MATTKNSPTNAPAAMAPRRLSWRRTACRVLPDRTWYDRPRSALACSASGIATAATSSQPMAAASGNDGGKLPIAAYSW